MCQNQTISSLVDPVTMTVMIPAFRERYNHNHKIEEMTNFKHHKIGFIRWPIFSICFCRDRIFYSSHFTITFSCFEVTTLNTLQKFVINIISLFDFIISASWTFSNRLCRRSTALSSRTSQLSNAFSNNIFFFLYFHF